MKTLILALAVLTASVALYSQNKQFILDADTGNEMDDLYAITRVMLDKEASIIALSSAHFNNLGMIAGTGGDSLPLMNTVKESQRLNKLLAQACNREDIPLPEGANRFIGEAWGITERYSPSEASSTIIREAKKKMEKKEKLDVLCIGASTNLASAMMEAPEIIPHIRAYLLAGKYDKKEGIWDKSEYNVRNDLNAFDYLMNNKELEMYVMPVTTAQTLRFIRNETQERLKEDCLLAKILSARWDYVSAKDDWIMWDLALVEAYLNPSVAETEICLAPPENGRHPVHVYTSVNAPEIKATFWRYYDKK
ncbi:MAG: nucleoside hydrolase [Tannerellaceae bacterium]|jgi:inosine-uridine nucleoside N-ribohydrolase|nr:nucleoside hydrolase [Tannerellaceae bacterium]